MFFIKDGNGTKNKVKVNSDNELVVTNLRCSPMLIATQNGNSYSWRGSMTTSVSGGETVLIVRNRSTRYLYLERVVLSASAGGSFTVFHTNDSGAFSGNGVTAINLNFGHSNIPDGVEAFSDETVNFQTSVMFNAELSTATPSMEFDLSGFILNKNSCIGIDVDDASTEAVVTVYGYFMD